MLLPQFGYWLERADDTDFGYFGLMFCAPFGLAALILVISRPLSRLLLPRRDPEPGEPAKTRLVDVQSVVISTFGLFLLATEVPSLAAQLLVDRAPNADPLTPPPAWYHDLELDRMIISVLVGAALVTGAGYWSRLLHRFRNLGYSTKPVDTSAPTS